MAYIVTDKCIGCKYTDCVDVCPVNCFHEGPNAVAIDPDRCIDCGACEPVCPAKAIISELDPLSEKWLGYNRQYSKKWPTIFNSKAPLPEAENFKKKENKLHMLDEG